MPRYKRKNGKTKEEPKKKGNKRLKFPFLKSSVVNNNPLRNGKCTCILDDDSQVSSLFSSDESHKNKDSYKIKYEVGPYVLPADVDIVNATIETSSSCSSSSASFHTAAETEKRHTNITKDKKRTKPRKGRKIVETTDREEEKENVKLVLEDFDNVIDNGNFNIRIKKPKKRGKKNSKKDQSVEKVLSLSRRLSYRIRQSESFSPTFSPVNALRLDFTKEILCSDSNHAFSSKKSGRNDKRARRRGKNL